MRSDNGDIIRNIAQKMKGQPLGPVIIRALAINAAMLNDKALYDSLLTTFVNNNADITDMDKLYLSAIQAQWFQK